MNRKEKLKNFAVKAGTAAAGLALTTGVALADATESAGELRGRVSDIELIGYASLALCIAIWGFKYLRRAG